LNYASTGRRASSRLFQLSNCYFLLNYAFLWVYGG